MRDTDLALILALDYIPVLSPSAMKVYLCYYALKNGSDFVDVTFANLTEHLGMSSSTISKYNDELKEIGLIEITGNEEGPTCHAPYRSRQIRILSPTPLTTNKRKSLFGEKTDSEIREKALAIEKLPLEYQQLLSKKDLQKAYKKLKRERFTVANLIDFFNLDREKVRLWLSSKTFKIRLMRAMKDIVEEASRTEVQQELKVIRTKRKGGKIKTADEMYETLMKAGFDKEGNPVPIKDWTPSQLLRHFCILYEKKCNTRYTIVFPDSKSFSSKEIKDVAVVLRAFNNNAVEAVKYMEWVFDNKEEKLPSGILGPGVLRIPTMINEYKKKASRPTKIRKVDPIDEHYVRWIKENVPKIFDQCDLNRMEDLYWLKEAYDGGQGQVSKEIKTVVEEGINRGIIPKEGNITFSK